MQSINNLVVRVSKCGNHHTLTTSQNWERLKTPKFFLWGTRNLLSSEDSFPLEIFLTFNVDILQPLIKLPMRSIYVSFLSKNKILKNVILGFAWRKLVQKGEKFLFSTEISNQSQPWCGSWPLAWCRIQDIYTTQK